MRPNKSVFYIRANPNLEPVRLPTSLGKTLMSSIERPSPTLKDFVAFPLLYFLGAKAGVILTVMPEGMAILWPPNGVLLAAFIHFRGRGYLPFAGLILGAEVTADLPTFGLAEALLFGLNNIAEATLAWALLSRWRFDPRFTRPADLVKFIAAGPLLAALLAATLGGMIYSVFRGSETGYLEFLRIWWTGDALGLMIVTPLFLGAWSRPFSAPSPRASAHLPDALVGIGALTVLGLLIASQDGALRGIHVGPVLLLPFVIYVAARFTVFTTTLAVVVVSLAVLTLTTRGQNPFGHASSRDAVIHAQEFLFIMSTLALGLASLLTQLRAHQRELVQAYADLSNRAQALERTNLELSSSKAEITALNEGLEQRVRERTKELEDALAQVKHLQGLLPICAWCKKVRDDKDYWHSVEDYITERSEAKFSHSICPDCYVKIMAEPMPVKPGGA